MTLVKRIFEKRGAGAIRKFRGGGSEVVTFDELKKIPLNQPIQISEEKGKIEAVRLTSNNENLMFSVSILKGERWKMHAHNCTELLYRGRLKNLLNGNAINKAQSMFFESYESHHIKAEKDSIFYVEFKKPK